MEISPRHFGKLDDRSEHALRYELDISAGGIAHYYRGEVRIILRNQWNEDFAIEKSDSIA